MNALRSLARGVAKNNMKRAGFKHVNMNMKNAPWRDYLRMKDVRAREKQKKGAKI